VTPAKKRDARITPVVVAGALLVTGAAYFFWSDSISSSVSGEDACSLVAMGTTTRSIGAVVLDEGTGREFISNQIMVGFKGGVSYADICGLILKLDGRVMQRFTNVPLFLIEVPDAGDGEIARRAVRKFLDSDIVDDASLNYLDVPTVATTSDIVVDSNE
jgi:hypothetical protein